MDTARLEELHIVRKIRETVRRWWGIELSFADAKGSVVDHGRGIIIPPDNQICSACLSDKEGLRRCNRSIEQAVGALSGHAAAGRKQPAEGAAQLLGPCHMGLDIVASPIQFGGARHGALFACGFLVEEHVEPARHAAQAELVQLGLPVQPSAFQTVGRIDRRDLGRLADMMGTTVGEIAEYEDALSQRDASIRDLRRELSGRYRFADIIGKSAPMQRLFALLEKVVDSDITVLVTGENGTGKELVARAIHFNGPRRDKPFVVQNCSALNDNLLESELFGHTRGAFTGAARDKVGLFKAADGGTFFLDEVADCSPAMQVKLLRVLQEGTLVPVGATRPESVDVRIVAATNKDLRAMVEKGQFREDLFYRLHVLNVEMPALRTRLDDLPLLTQHFLGKLAKRSGRPQKRLHPQLLKSLYESRWPGNVRELENEIERLWVLAGDAEVIPPELRDGHASAPRPQGVGALRDLQALVQRGLGTGLDIAVAELERELIRAGLDQTKGNKTRLASMLGVSRTTLIKKIKDYGIDAAED
jgi:transcriptional regulator with PAS, ATPase and Fis domain